MNKKKKTLFGKSREKNKLGRNRSKSLSDSNSSSLYSNSIPSPLIVATAARAANISTHGESSESSGTVFLQVPKSKSSSVASSPHDRMKAMLNSSNHSQNLLYLGEPAISSANEDMKPRYKSLYQEEAVNHDEYVRQSSGLSSALAHYETMLQTSHLSTKPSRSQSHSEMEASSFSTESSNLRSVHAGKKFLSIQSMFPADTHKGSVPPPSIDSILGEMKLIHKISLVSDFVAIRDIFSLLLILLEQEECDSSAVNPIEVFYSIKKVAEISLNGWLEIEKLRKGRIKGGDDTFLKDKKSQMEDLVEEPLLPAEGDECQNSKAPQDQEDEEATRSSSSHISQIKDVQLYKDSEWNQLEEIWWEIAENSISCVSVLSVSFIGPIFHKQIRSRKERIKSLRNHSTSSILSKDTGRSVPESLPLEILNFISNFGNSILPPAKSTHAILSLRRSDQQQITDEEDGMILIKHIAKSRKKKIWEERRWLIRRQRFSEQQRNLTSALCIDSHDDKSVSGDESGSGTNASIGSKQSGIFISKSKRYPWNIPGAHKPVANMARSWISTALVGWPEEIVKDYNDALDPTHYIFTDNSHIKIVSSSIFTSGSIDWWYTFQVAKSISDLVKAGWRPPPSKIDGGKSITGLLQISKLGVLLEPSVMKYNHLDYHSDAREERIIAVSAAMEALESLQILGSRGFLPNTMIQNTSLTMCYLLAIIDPTTTNIVDSDLFPVPSNESPDEHDELNIEIDTFFDQRDACLNEIAELLWSMLALEGSMEIAVDALFGVLRNIDLSLLRNSENGNQDSSVIESILSACGAVRSLGASIWGNPPEIKGIASLRICWSSLLDLLTDVSSSIFEDCPKIYFPSAKLKSTIISSSIGSLASKRNDDTFEDSFYCIPSITDLGSFNPTCLALILEIAIAVKRLVEGEMLSGIDNLSIYEWDSFLSILERGFLPWLALSYANTSESSHARKTNFDKVEDRNIHLSKCIQTEVLDIFHHVKIFFTIRQEGTLTQHRISDESIRRRFYLFFLQRVSPLLRPEDATFICTSIISAWVCGGAFLHSSHDWQQKCSDLLLHTFAVYEEKSYGYDGYVHPRLVRQTALRVFVESDEDDLNLEELGSFSSSYRRSASVVDKFTKNIHGASVCKVMIPFLSEIILAGQSHQGHVFPNPSTHITSHCVEKYTKQTKLVLSAIRVVGDLLISSQVDFQDRTTLLNMLKSCILDKSLERHLSMPSSEGLLASALQLGDWGKWTAIKLGTIKQLGLYLRACLGHLSNLHYCVPDILKILFDTIRTFYNYEEVPSATIAARLVSFAALFQISCLQNGDNGNVFMIDESTLINSFPNHLAVTTDKIKFIMDAISVHQVWDDSDMIGNYAFHPVDISHSTQASSRVYFTSKKNDINEERDEKKYDYQHPHVSTLISFDEILAVMKDIMHVKLQDTSKSPNQNFQFIKFIFPSDSDGQNALDELCYERIKLHILSGAITDPIGCWASFTDHSNHNHTSIGYIHFLSSVAGFVSYCDDEDACTRTFEALLNSFGGDNLEDIKVSCEGMLCSLSGMDCASSTQVDRSRWHQKVCKTLLQQIRPILDNVSGYSYEINESPIKVLLSTLYGALLMFSSQKYHCSGRMKGDIIILCHDICTSITNDKVETQIFVLAVLCASVAAASIDTDDLTNIISLISKRRPSVPSSENIENKTIFEFADIIFDLLVQKCLEYSSTKPLGDSNNSKLSRLELVAKDVQDIDAFKANESDEKNIGAWLCNRMLLICRVSTGDDRYQGHVEIILRSPTTRIRRLVRLPSTISLVNPDFPSNLWDSVLPPSTEKVYSKDAAEEIEIVQSAFYDEAETAMKKFDSQFVKRPQSDLGVYIKQREHDSRNSKHRYEESPSSLYTKPTEATLNSPSNMENITSNFRQYLSIALNGNSNDMEQVEDALHELDGSTYLLDSIYSISDEPVRLKWGPKLRRAVNILDRTASLQTHKIALMLAVPFAEQTKSEPALSTEVRDDWILSVTNVTPLFSKFTAGLGSFISTTHLRIFSGGMDTSNYTSDGNFALSWLSGEQLRENSPCIGETMVVFHSVPHMPPGVNNRKRHVGNDIVHIIFYDNSSCSPTVNHCDYNNIISGEFCFVTIFVVPVCANKFAKVTLKIKEDLSEKIKKSLDYLSSSVIIPFDASPVYTRELAIRADVACRSLIQDRLGLVSNWQERLQQIKNLDRYTMGPS